MDSEQQTGKIDSRNFDDVLSIVSSIKSQVGEKTAHAEIGIICGSGFGSVGDLILNPTVLPYSKIPGFPLPKIDGHKGNLIFGTLGEKKIVCVQGRFHPYEHGMDLVLCSLPVRVMHQLGIKIMIVSNAAGGISDKTSKGELMLIKDHIFLPGLMGLSPLVGLKDPRYGMPFVSMQDAYDKNLRNLAKEIGRRCDMISCEGVYCMVGGPQFETSAEVNLLKTFGADAVGMSTCHEVTVARHCGIRVLAFSLITNVANSSSEETEAVGVHQEVLDVSNMVGEKVSQFVVEVIKGIAI